MNVIKEAIADRRAMKLSDIVEKKVVIHFYRKGGKFIVPLIFYFNDICYLRLFLSISSTVRGVSLDIRFVGRKTGYCLSPISFHSSSSHRVNLPSALSP